MPFINVGTNEENILGGAGAWLLHRLRLRPKSTGSDRLQLRNTE